MGPGHRSRAGHPFAPWDPATGAERAALTGHAGWANAVAFAPDGNLASGGYDCTLRLWDPATGAERAALTGPVNAVAFAPGSRRLSERTNRRWSHVEGRWHAGRANLDHWRWPADARAQRPCPVLVGRAAEIDALIAALDGAAHDRGSVVFLVGEAGIGKPSARSGAGRPGLCPSPRRAFGHPHRPPGWVNAVAFALHGTLASGGGDGTVRLWYPATGAELAALSLGASVTSVAWAPNGTSLAVAFGPPSPCSASSVAADLGKSARATASVPVPWPDMSVQPAPRRFCVEEYYRMAEAGILDEDDRVELLEGEVVSMAPVGSRHATCVRRIGRLLSERLGQQVIVSIQNPLRLDRHPEPQPDVVVLERGPDEYARAHPGPAEVLLLVEVADTTATYDRRRRIPVYAAAAIPEVWLVDLDRDVIDVYCRPQGGSYQESSSFGRGEVVRPLRLPELAIELGDILPPA